MRTRTLSPTAAHLLERLRGAGGCPFIRLSQVAYGVPRSFMSPGERQRLNAHLRNLEKRGLVAIHRDWGTLGFGRPTWIEVTQAGAALVGSDAALRETESVVS